MLMTNIKLMIKKKKFNLIKLLIQLTGYLFFRIAVVHVLQASSAVFCTPCAGRWMARVREKLDLTFITFIPKDLLETCVQIDVMYLIILLSL